MNAVYRISLLFLFLSALLFSSAAFSSPCWLDRYKTYSACIQMNQNPRNDGQLWSTWCHGCNRGWPKAQYEKCVADSKANWIKGCAKRYKKKAEKKPKPKYDCSDSYFKDARLSDCSTDCNKRCSRSSTYNACLHWCKGNLYCKCEQGGNKCPADYIPKDGVCVKQERAKPQILLDNNRFTLNFDGNSSIRISGKVRKPSGQGVSGVAVSASIEDVYRHFGGYTGSVKPNTLRTGADGGFVFTYRAHNANNKEKLAGKHLTIQFRSQYGNPKAYLYQQKLPQCDQYCSKKYGIHALTMDEKSKRKGECACDCKLGSEWNREFTRCNLKKPTAYLFISDNLSNYEAAWTVHKRKHIRNYFRQKGYEVWTMKHPKREGMLDRILQSNTRAIAYFGHGAGYDSKWNYVMGSENVKPTIEYNNARELLERAESKVIETYIDMGMSRQKAEQHSKARFLNNTFGLEYAYIHACFSLDDTSMAHALLKSGGTYWGDKGKLFPTETLYEYRKP